MTRRPPTPRSGVYELYWHYTSQRHAMFERRAAGIAPPWSSDPILNTFKFCNVYRAVDRVSQYMIRDVCYHDETCTAQDRIFQIVAFRTFSKIDTWRVVRNHLGRYPTLDDLADGGFTAALEYAQKVNGGLYTGAFILCAQDAYGRGRKYLNHIELFRHMFLADNLADEILDAARLRDVYDLLHGYPLMGDFMSYQIAIDLNYSSLLHFSENEFTQPGPGALRGIRKCFTDLSDYTPAEVVLWMVDNQSAELERLQLPFNGLYGRPLHAIDCQSLFCETDKYCREAVPDLVSARRRIKSRFTQNVEPITLFFPPKWDIKQPVDAATVQTPHAVPQQGTLF